MTLLRRLSYGALALAFAHIVFGAIVRITGSGLGCGDHWPRCFGYWFPPLTRMDLVIEVSHRYLAFALSMTIVGLLVLAFTRRRTPGVGGAGGVLRPIALASVLVVTAALFGALTVKFELRNKGIIVVHLAIAISTLAALAMAVVRAGGLGGAQAVAGSASPETWRGARVAAGLAFAAVVLGGLTAHIVGANGACVGFPHCPRGIPTPGAPLHVHLTHRVIAFLLFFHLLGMVFAVRKRGESPLLQWAVRIAFGTVLLQIVVAAALVELYLPPVLRSLHQAVGTLVWLSIFVLAVLARRGSHGWEEGARLTPHAPNAVPAPESHALRRGAAGVATGVATFAAEAMAPLTPGTMVEAVPPTVAVARATPPAAMPVIVVAPAIDEPVVVEDRVAIEELPEKSPEELPEELTAEDAEDAEESLLEQSSALPASPAVRLSTAAVEAVEVVEDLRVEVVDETVEVDQELVDDAPVLTFDDEVAAQLEAVVGRDPFEDDDAVMVAMEEELDADDDFAAAIAAALGDEPVPDEPAVEAAAMIAVDVAVDVQIAAAPLPPVLNRRPPTLAVLIARGADF